MATGRFHFNRTTGRTGRCDARIACRLGLADNEHFTTEDGARQAAEAHLAKVHGGGLQGLRRRRSSSDAAPNTPTVRGAWGRARDAVGRMAPSGGRRLYKTVSIGMAGVALATTLSACGDNASFGVDTSPQGRESAAATAEILNSSNDIQLSKKTSYSSQGDRWEVQAGGQNVATVEAATIPSAMEHTYTVLSPKRGVVTGTGSTSLETGGFAKGQQNTTYDEEGHRTGTISYDAYGVKKHPYKEGKMRGDLTVKVREKDDPYASENTMEFSTDRGSYDQGKIKNRGQNVCWTYKRERTSDYDTQYSLHRESKDPSCINGVEAVRLLTMAHEMVEAQEGSNQAAITGQKAEARQEGRASSSSSSSSSRSRSSSSSSSSPRR